MADTRNEDLPFDWLQRDKHVIEGLDHLGIEVVSANIYGALLPGLTNVTDRARYYSFYPWVLHRYAQSAPPVPDRKAWLTWFRQLEYSYAAACAAWEMSGKTGAHATAVVGVDAARREIGQAGNKIDLQALAVLDASGKIPSKAYFKNPEGGLGQYYKVPLGILGLLRKDEQHRFPDRQLTLYAGRRVAESLDAQPGFSRLLDVAMSGRADISDLAKLGAEINPSAIGAGTEEERLLRNLFLGEGDDLCQGQRGPSRQQRRVSLRLVLEFIADRKSVEGEFAQEFRWACMQVALAPGRSWKLTRELKQTALAWSAYQRNDLMNYALECLFWVVLRRVDEGLFTPSEVVRHVAALSRGPVKTPEKHPGTQAIGQRVSEWVAACGGESAEALRDPMAPNSIRGWADQLERAVSKEDDAGVARWAIRVCGRVISAEESLPSSGGGLEVWGAVAKTYEVHIAALASRAARRAADVFTTFLEELLLEWVLYRHLRVATRKLAGQGVSTFKFRPEQGALLLVTDKIPIPTYTNPRLRQAHRILTDLHYVSVDETGASQITADGAAVIRKP